jgi:hypothetical protein
MAKWEWLENPTRLPTWGFMLRVVVKAALLFVVLNLLFALINPIEALGRVSLYNTVLPGRMRLPYGENASQSYSLSLNNIPAMFASHEISQPKADDEYRLLLIGDSATWGWFLEPSDTLAAAINAGNYRTEDGRRIVAYNLGYPVMSLTKDLLLLDYAMRYEPDLIVWAFTLESFPREKQLVPAMVQQNPGRVRDLIRRYDLDLDVNDSRFVEADFLDRTIVGQRRELADWLRLQVYGFSWAATGIDQFIPVSYERTAIDLSDDLAWNSEGWDGIAEPRDLTADEMVFDVLRAGIERAGDVPVLLVNEPMLVSNGANSDIRYNAFFPRWAYDSYRVQLKDIAIENDWPLLDMWNSMPATAFIDSPVHMTPEATRQTAEAIVPFLLEVANKV